MSWAVFVNDPLGGEPVAVVAAKPPAPSQAKPDGDGDGKQHSRYDGPTATAPDPAAAARRQSRDAAARHQDDHHHRRLQRQEPGRGHSRQFRQPRRAEGAGRPKAAGDHAAWRDPENRAGRRAPVGALCASARIAAQPKRFAAHRHRDRRRRHQRLRHGRRLRQAAGAGDLRAGALRRRSRKAGGTRAAKITRCCCRCRWSRSTIPTTIPARRRCSPRSRPSRTSTACNG